jgi:hypothetical protein
MNQQQDSQGSSGRFQDDQEQSTLASPWLIQHKGRKHEGPKSEHPSTFDESIPPLSYRAQDQRQTSTSSSPAKAGASPGATYKTSPEADASKRAQRPYSQYTGTWQVPSWAKPQENHFGNIWFYVLIAILALPVLWFIITVILPLVALVVLVVLVVVGILLLAFVIIAALWFIGRVDSMKPPFWW